MATLKTYTISTDVTGGVVDAPDLNTEIANSGHVAGFTGLSVSGDSLEIFGDSFVSEISLDTLVQNHIAITLDEYKVAKYDAIDKRTGELIGNGFEYPASSGQIFSFSENAQNNLLGAYSAKDLVGYPFDWNTKDDSVTIQLADAAEMTTFFMTALGTKKAHQDSGTTLKTSVRNAVDKAGVDAVIDNR